MSAQMTADPRTQAAEEKEVSGRLIDKQSDSMLLLTHARDGAHHPAPQVVGSHGEWEVAENGNSQ